MTTSTVWLWLGFGLIVLGLAACSDDFVALIRAGKRGALGNAFQHGVITKAD